MTRRAISRTASRRACDSRGDERRETSARKAASWKKPAREKKREGRPREENPASLSLRPAVNLFNNDHRVSLGMSSRVKQQIRITIFFNDGTVVIYI